MLLFFATASIFAQPYPTSFTLSITGCFPPGSDGNYTRSITDKNGCPCYENTSNNSIAFVLSGDWQVGTSSDGTCAGGVTGIMLYQENSPCDISDALVGSCDPATSLSNIQYAPPASIPTLSEWGLIVLALLLMTLGTLYLLQPKWKGGFEQES